MMETLHSIQNGYMGVMGTSGGSASPEDSDYAVARLRSPIHRVYDTASTISRSEIRVKTLSQRDEDAGKFAREPFVNILCMESHDLTHTADT